MKKLMLLSALFAFVFSLSLVNPPAATAVQQSTTNTEDDVAALKKANASLKIQLSRQRIQLMKQIQLNDSSISKLKAASNRQQAAIGDLQKSLSGQQAALDKVPDAINKRSQLFGTKRILAVSLIIGAFILVLIYVLNLRKQVAAFHKDLKKLEDNLSQKQAQANAELKSYLSGEVSDLKAMLERQTTENKNRIIALLADANQLVHKMGDEVTRSMDTKLTALKGELNAGMNQINERFKNSISNNSL